MYRKLDSVAELTDKLYLNHIEQKHNVSNFWLMLQYMNPSLWPKNWVLKKVQIEKQVPAYHYVNLQYALGDHVTQNCSQFISLHLCSRDYESDNSVDWQTW